MPDRILLSILMTPAENTIVHPFSFSITLLFSHHVLLFRHCAFDNVPVAASAAGGGGIVDEGDISL